VKEPACGSWRQNVDAGSKLSASALAVAVSATRRDANDARTAALISGAGTYRESAAHGLASTRPSAEGNGKFSASADTAERTAFRDESSAFNARIRRRNTIREILKTPTRGEKRKLMALDLWAALRTPANPASSHAEGEVIERLVDRALAQSDANETALNQAKADEAKRRRAEERQAKAYLETARPKGA
jgi:hypothetical protein